MNEVTTPWTRRDAIALVLLLTVVCLAFFWLLSGRERASKNLTAFQGVASLYHTVGADEFVASRIIDHVSPSSQQF